MYQRVTSLYVGLFLKLRGWIKIMSILAGIPGQLKTLLDRLTSGRASNLDNPDVASSNLALATKQVDKDDLTVARIEKLDNVNAAVTTIASATTALSTTTYWTDARAGYLDLLNTNLDGKVSEAGGGIPVAGATGETGQLKVTATSWTTCLDLTSEAGVLCLLKAFGGDSEGRIAGYIKVTIDGVSVFGTTGIPVSGDDTFHSTFDASYAPASCFDISMPLPYTSSLKIEAKAFSTSFDIYCRWAVLKT